MHVGDVRHDRGRAHALQLGQPIDQPAQMRRDFRGVAGKDIAKPLADLVADGAGVGTIKSYHRNIAGGHRRFPDWFRSQSITPSGTEPVNGHGRIRGLVKNW